MKLSFLLEIGTEELPPGLIAATAEEIKHRIIRLLKENNLGFEKEKVFFTPRRLAVYLSGVPKEKPAMVLEVPGPPKNVGFDPEGKPTNPAIGFAATHKKMVEDLFIKTTPKGEYLFVKKELPPVPTKEIFLGHLPKIITTLSFPKTMRWKEGPLRFPRPVRWLLCLLGKEILPFEIDGITASNTTWGHRNFTAGPLPLSTPEDYESLLEQHKVIVSPTRRREKVVGELNQIASRVGGEVVEDLELLGETVNITEFPEPVLGKFNPQYLNLPREVLITALKMHQRCFSVEDKSGKLLPYFITVVNTPGCDKDIVRAWSERAIESRLRDAQFFVEADLKTGLEPLVEKEKGVVWIEGLGSCYEKTQRLRQLVAYLGSAVGACTKLPALDRAALLCKVDLLSQLVREKEFTSLQGVAGEIYARLSGEPTEVAQAIGEHYLPKTPDDKLPETVMGGILSIADKVDNIVATYLTGNIPTGSEDPFAVRRQATGLLLIILEKGFPVEIPELIDRTLSLFGELGGLNIAPNLRKTILELFRERLKALLEEKGIRYDVANAVLSTAWHTPSEAFTRAETLARFRTATAEFKRLVIGQKRVANILRGENVSGLPNPSLFIEDAERSLYSAAQQVEGELNNLLAQSDYDQALSLLLALRPNIDRLFDDVLIMHEDDRLRTNRLRLLNHIRSLFARVADLSEIALD